MSLILCLNELILFVDFKTEDGSFHIFGNKKDRHFPSSTSICKGPLDLFGITVALIETEKAHLHLTIFWSIV